MSEALQKLLDERSREIDLLIPQTVSSEWVVKHKFQDFTRLVRDAEFEISLDQASQIFELMDRLENVGHLAVSDKDWMLGTLLLQIKDEDTERTGIADRVVIDAVDASARRIKEKHNQPVIAGSKLFDFAAFNAQFLGDQALYVLFAHSRDMTRFVDEDGRENKFLLDCSSGVVQSYHPANMALTSMLALNIGPYEDSVDWSRLSDDTPEKRYFLRFLDQLSRISELGISVKPNTTDILQISGLVKRLIQLESDPHFDDQTKLAIQKAIHDVFGLFRPDGDPPAPQDNLFKYPIKPRTIAKVKHKWFAGGLYTDFISDVSRNLSELVGATKGTVYEADASSFISNIFLHAAQAHGPLQKEAKVDNQSFLRETAKHCKEFLAGENPLKGLKKDERLAVLNAVEDPSMRKNLLSRYKSDKGQALMSDLGI
ncbi:hypothetical protein [Pseudomonas putida]|uniref:Uncharacterized protein n=1 Tax=Pseudomonas putida TaxID=303 RepID=A0A8I1EA13_PSEPU|nr:hypothetical protein [Pseudomonas putida]MBI6882585.1 hypothetical protein [Pseudomonas putida]